MKAEIADSLGERALTAFLRTDSIQADTAELVDFKDYRWGGKYILLSQTDKVIAVYKVVPRLGSPKAVRTESGGVAFQVDSFSLGLKLLKRWPKGLVGKES